MGLTIWWNLSALLIMWTYANATAGNEDATKSLDPRSYVYGCGDCEPPTPPSDGCLGAVYFTTNNELGNWVVVNCIQPDGTLVFNNTISTQGTGSSAFFQYFLVDYMITGDNFLFVANAGSNSVSMFNINPQSPEKLTFVTSVNSQGSFPACLAYSSALNLLCVINAGEINNVACFKVTPTDLTPLPDTVKSVGESDPRPPPYANSVSDIIFTANSEQVVVALRGHENVAIPVPGSIVVFPVMSEGTALGDPVINKIPHFYPGELTLIPTTICNNNQQNMMYSAFNYDDNTDPGLELFVLPPSGKIDPASIVDVPIPDNSGTGWSKFSPRTGHLYTIENDNKVLTETSIECLDDGRLNGTVVEQYPVKEFEADVVIASLPNGDYLYTIVKISSLSVPVIDVYSLGNTPGNVTLIQEYTPDNSTIVDQTGQPLGDFNQGIAAFIAQPQAGGGGGGHQPPCGCCGHHHRPPTPSQNVHYPFNYQLPGYRRYRYPPRP